MPSRVRIATKKVKRSSFPEATAAKKVQRSSLPDANATKKVQRSSLPDTVTDDGVFVEVREESGGGVQVIRRSDTTSQEIGI